MSKMEGETNFSRRLKQFDGLTWIYPTPLPHILRQIYATGNIIVNRMWTWVNSIVQYIQ